MGDPPGYYCHTKMINPTKAFILSRQRTTAVGPFYLITYAKRPAEELYDVEADPNCLRNLAANPDQAAVLTLLRTRLDEILTEQADPRMVGCGDIFDSYPYFGRMQPGVGGFREPGKYNPRFFPPGHPEKRSGP